MPGNLNEGTSIKKKKQSFPKHKKKWSEERNKCDSVMLCSDLEKCDDDAKTLKFFSFII